MHVSSTIHDLKLGGQLLLPKVWGEERREGQCVTSARPASLDRCPRGAVHSSTGFLDGIFHKPLGL